MSLAFLHRRLLGAPHDSHRGQVLVIVAGAFVAIVAMLALLFDGANGYVVRRQLQSATDAAALAAANVVQSDAAGTCSPVGGNPPGPPYPAVIAAAKASVAENLPDYPLDEVHVSCPANWDNYGVHVELATTTPRFFSVIWSRDDLAVQTRGTAINGYFTERNYSVVTLNEAYQGHPQARDGCPSVLFSGGPTIIMDSAMHINSGCLAPDGGALGTNGNAASLTMGRGAPIRIQGDYVPGTLTIEPPPLTGSDPIDDPLEDDVAAFTFPPLIDRGSFNSNCNGCTTILKPGEYQRIRLGGQARAVMEPGVYKINGGGLQLGAQTQLYSVKDLGGDQARADAVSPETWAADCPTDGSCGVLIFNTTNTGGAMGAIEINAGATVKLRASSAYKGVLMWQDKVREPDATYAQPVVTLSGGGEVDMTGTVYAPSARILLRGGAGGSGGGEIVELAMRFVSYDLQFNGNSTFHFIYVADEDSKPMDYGLVDE